MISDHDHYGDGDGDGDQTCARLRTEIVGDASPGIAAVPRRLLRIVFLMTKKHALRPNLTFSDFFTHSILLQSIERLNFASTGKSTTSQPMMCSVQNNQLFWAKVHFCFASVYKSPSKTGSTSHHLLGYQ